MKVECVKDLIEKAVLLTSRVTGKHTNLPVLSCVKIETRKNELQISATNLDLGVECVVPAKIFKEGVVAVPGLTLSGFLSNLPHEKNIILEVFQGNLRVISSKNSTIIKAIPHDDFPEIPHPEGGNSVSLPAKDFIQGLSSVSHFSSTSAVKPELGSVLLYGDGEWLYFVATDSFRLGEKRIKLKNTIETQALIPAKNASEILRVVSEEDGLVELRVHKHQLSITSGSFFGVSRLVEGTFPDYKQIVPKDHTTTAVALKEDLNQVFKTLSIFSDKFNQLHISVFPREKRFEFSTKNSEVGESHYTLPASLSGDLVEVNFNIRYLADCLPVIGADSVSLEFGGSGRPLLVRGVGDSSFLYLVMPMNK